MSFLALMRYSEDTKKACPTSESLFNPDLNEKTFYQKMKERMKRMYSFFESYKKS
jgi:hypothetical protein